MILGVDYHPEQWPDDRWPEDARLMKEAGVSVVRLGQFAWSHIESDDNYYNLRWLNRVMDILLKQGIKSVLAIPTGSPPPWLVAKFPEILPMDADGRRLQPGTYNHRCFLNKHYHDYARNFTMRLTKEIWGHRGIIGWQIEGKIGAHRCYCETCHRAFLEWLKNKYHVIERLNAEWGTVAWGQQYTEFIEIPLPWRTTGAANDVRAHNPSSIMDFWRFSADMVSEFVREQAIIIQRYTTRQFITIDCDAAWDGQNCQELAKSVDFVSCGSLAAPTPAAVAFRCDLFRGLKQKDFWVMEHPIGARGWNELAPPPPPGQSRMQAWQAIGHGANAIVFSPWRSSVSGTAQLDEGVLGHDGVPRRRYEEVKRFGEELHRLNPFLEGSQPKHSVAILWDHEQNWALQIQRQTAGKGVDYVDIACRFHEGLRRLGIGCELVGWQQDFAPYKLLLFPPQYLLDAERAKKLSQYVADGGTAVLSTRTAIKNLRNVHHAEPAPALLRELLGIEVIDTDPVGDARSNVVRLTSGEEFEATRWCDVLALKGAEALGQYAKEFYKDAPALTVQGHGTGKACYIGTVMTADFYRLFLARLAEQCGLPIYKDLPEHVDLVARHKDGKEFLFLTNQSGEPQSVTICRKGKNLLDDALTEGTVSLEPYEVAVVQIRET